MRGGRKLRPVSTRYDAYLIITVGLAFIFAGVWGATHPEPDWFGEFLLVCGIGALVAVTFILLNKRR